MCPSAGLDVRYKKETCPACGFCSHCQCLFLFERWSMGWTANISPHGLQITRFTISQLWFWLSHDITIFLGWKSENRRQCCLLRLAPRPGEVDNVRWKYGVWRSIRLFIHPSKSRGVFEDDVFDLDILFKFQGFSYIRENLLTLELKSWQSWHNLSWWLLIWNECIFIIDGITPWEVDIHRTWTYVVLEKTSLHQTWILGFPCE